MSDAGYNTTGQNHLLQCTAEEAERTACLKGGCVKIEMGANLYHSFCSCDIGWTGDRCELRDIDWQYYRSGIDEIGILFISLASILILTVIIAFAISRRISSNYLRKKKLNSKAINRQSAILEETDLQPELLSHDNNDYKSYPIISNPQIYSDLPFIDEDSKSSTVDEDQRSSNNDQTNFTDLKPQSNQTKEPSIFERNKQ